MRKKIVAGNWKMNTTINEGIALAREVSRLVVSKSNIGVKVILAPPFTHITEVLRTVNTDMISVASQNCASESKGAYTGEVSADMISSAGCTYCIIGHSERRAYYNEVNSVLLKKIKLAIENNLIPIFCCGEVLKEREEGKLFDVIKSQLKEGLFEIPAKDFSKVIIAYEPVWAIGTGVVASPAQAQEMHSYIRNLISENYGSIYAEETTILYGGSCNASNAKELFSQQDIDGGLIGGASLKADDFYKIITSF